MRHPPVRRASAMSDPDFYDRLPVFEGFTDVVDPSRYRPLPASWWVGVTDVVGSTRAIDEGRYKAVNTVGASAISAVSNALGNRRFPFVFGGDGAGFAVSGEDAAKARAALAATVTWSDEAMNLPLRAAMVPVAAIETAGFAVGVARYAPSRNVAYAMFAGGGLAWAEQAMKAGEHAVVPAPAGAHPDLNGLSCRWSDFPATRGTILSLLVAPVGRADEAFRALVTSLIREIDTSGEAVRPLPAELPGASWPPAGLDIEASAQRRAGEPMTLARMRVRARALLAHLIFRTGMKVGGFDPARYLAETIENSDFRKYDDHLRMTIDCTTALADRVQAMLERARAGGIARFGIHRQASAIMTCVVPTPTRSDHIHFIDGAGGGYALAARAMKAS